jgi:hypothetical protein
LRSYFRPAGTRIGGDPCTAGSTHLTTTASPTVISDYSAIGKAISNLSSEEIPKFFVKAFDLVFELGRATQLRRRKVKQSVCLHVRA